jgi:hypothetical protein
MQDSRQAQPQQPNLLLASLLLMLQLLHTRDQGCAIYAIGLASLPPVWVSVCLLSN